MLPEQAEEMLRNYRPYLGRCGYLATLIDGLKCDIKVMQAESREDLLNASGKQPDGMPHGTTVGNPTERIALMLASGYISGDVSELQREIQTFEAEYRQKKIVVMFVEAWMLGLTEKERWMIELCMFDHMTYREINVQYRDAHGESCSKDLLRRLKKDALAKIFEMAK